MSARASLCEHLDEAQRSYEEICLQIVRLNELVRSGDAFEKKLSRELEAAERDLVSAFVYLFSIRRNLKSYLNLINHLMI